MPQALPERAVQTDPTDNNPLGIVLLTDLAS